MNLRISVLISPAFLGALLLAFGGPETPSAQAQRQTPQQPGKPPQGQPGQPGFGGPPPFGPGGFGGPMGGERKLVKQFDKDGDGRLNRPERDAARESMKRDRMGGGRGGPGGPGGRGGRGGPGGPGMMAPGALIARTILEPVDTDKDGKVSQTEATAAVKKFFAEADKEKKGTLDEAQLGEEIQRRMPPPPGFPGGPGGPGGGPPGGAPPGGAPGGAPPFGGPPGGGRGGPGGGGFRIFMPSQFLAGPIRDKADTNKDSKLTLDELLALTNKLFKEADKDKDGKADEADVAEGIGQVIPPPTFGGPGFGGRGGRDPAKPGPRVAPADVKNYPDAKLYEPTVLRTIFLDFADKDWEAELADFKGTDVEVPATMTVDGKKYPNVGVHFRGMSSYMMVPAGYKRSLNLAMDFVDPKQRLYGYKTLNLLNANGDPSFLSTVLYSEIGKEFLPVPKANLVKVVINGESWGIYTNVQQFNKEFVADNFKGSQGARWKVRGSPGGAGGLEYTGDTIADYKRRFEMKSPDQDKDWKALIDLCKTLNQTPPDKLEAALKPILDVDGVLAFLALDVALINEDGYWTRASDYSIYRDGKGVFHIIPHDMNEAFHEGMGFGFGGPGGPGGRGGRGGPGDKPGGGFGRGGDKPGGDKPGRGGPGGPGMGPGRGGIELDPLIGLEDSRKPLRSRLLAVPAFRTKYLQYIRRIAEKSLDWKNLGPVVAQYRTLVEKEIEADTRKLSTFDAFKRATADAATAATPETRGPGGSLRSFVDRRRTFLLEHPEVKKAIP